MQSNADTQAYLKLALCAHVCIFMQAFVVLASVKPWNDLRIHRPLTLEFEPLRFKSGAQPTRVTWI